MDIKQVKVKELIPYAKNAKKHTSEQIEQVKNSIEQFGMVQPIVADKDNNVVIGHCRLLACKKLKFKEIPVLYAEDLTPEQVNALRLADNKTNESGWDFNLLSESIDEIVDISMEEFGFDLEQEIDWSKVTDLTEEAYEKPNKKTCTCPSCGFNDSAERFN